MGLIADAGFDAVMLWWGDEYRAANGTKEQLPELARRRGLWVENIHVPFSDANLLWKDGVTAESVYARYLSCIDACRDHGIPVMVLHATQGNHPPPAGPTGLDRLRRLVERAQRQDVTIALENLRQSEHLDRAFEAIPSDRL
ncbi:MAG: TIM barrel protein, partial [Clostridiaceae bacterium]|nr:TIM barrel protein [Clostridiaceae bacterium]